MYESGIRPRPYRTNGKPDSINGKLDALIEGQKGIVTVLNEGFKETNDSLKGINGALKGGLKETNDSLKGINDNLKGGLKEINETLQEIRDKVGKWRLRTQAPA